MVFEINLGWPRFRNITDLLRWAARSAVKGDPSRFEHLSFDRDMPHS